MKSEKARKRSGWSLREADFLTFGLWPSCDLSKAHHSNLSSTMNSRNGLRWTTMSLPAVFFNENKGTDAPHKVVSRITEIMNVNLYKSTPNHKHNIIIIKHRHLSFSYNNHACKYFRKNDTNKWGVHQLFQIFDIRFEISPPSQLRKLGVENWQTIV